jgi:hypothetical protein
MIRPRDLSMRDLKLSYLRNAMKNRPAGSPEALTDTEAAFLAEEINEAPEALSTLLAQARGC